MGKNLKVLTERTLPDRTKAAGRMLVDLCENIHIHVRELRQEFSIAEFFEHVRVLGKSAMDLKRYLKLNPDYKEQEFMDLVALMGNTPHLLEESPEPNQSTYFPNRFRIELTEPHVMGAIHLHWRDLRIHLSREELRILVEGGIEAEAALTEYERTHGYTDKPEPSAELVKKQASQKRPTPGPGHFARLTR